MYPEALHHAQTSRNGAIGHDPNPHMSRLWHQGSEIPERVVGGRGLRYRIVRLGLGRVDQIRKLHRILDEEYRHIVSDEIPIALIGVELNRKATHIARSVG